MKVTSPALLSAWTVSATRAQLAAIQGDGRIVSGDGAVEGDLRRLGSQVGEAQQLGTQDFDLWGVPRHVDRDAPGYDAFSLAGFQEPRDGIGGAGDHRADC